MEPQGSDGPDGSSIVSIGHGCVRQLQSQLTRLETRVVSPRAIREPEAACASPPTAAKCTLQANFPSSQAR
jgi:hypothetical protein